MTINVWLAPLKLTFVASVKVPVLFTSIFPDVSVVPEVVKDCAPAPEKINAVVTELGCVVTVRLPAKLIVPPVKELKHPPFPVIVKVPPT